MPIDVDIAYKDGTEKLEIEEDKFREKLEKEKEEWNTNVEQLRKDFEKV